MSTPTLIGLEKASEERRDELVRYVRAKVVSFGNVEALHFEEADKIVIEFKSGIERFIPYPPHA